MGELQNEKKHLKKKIAAILLMLCLLVTLLPVEYYGIGPLGDDGEDQIQWEILSFSALPEELSMQTVPLGTPLEELNLPSALTAICDRIVRGSGFIRDAGRFRYRNGIVRTFRYRR